MDSHKSQKETVLITGGGGYFGFRLGCALNQKGVHVILFDISRPETIPEGIRFILGDIRRLSDIENAFQGVDVACVFHIASYGMSGREQLNRSLIEEVNVGGTDNILQACRRRGVPRLVYTSTFNVIFGGQVIRNGDESLPYLPLHLHPDHYSRTKSIAEKKVLSANEMTHFILGRLYNFQPFLTRTEVYKTGVTHYFSLEKARKELGYEAQPFDLQEAVEWFKAHGHGRRPGSRDSKCLVWDELVILLLVTVVLMWLLPSVILSV